MWSEVCEPLIWDLKTTFYIDVDFYILVKNALSKAAAMEQAEECQRSQKHRLDRRPEDCRERNVSK